MRTVTRYPVSCTTYPVGTPLPAQQVLDIEQRVGEQMVALRPAGYAIQRTTMVGSNEHIRTAA